MRIFKNFQEMLSEVKRDLKEMGLDINNVGFQDKYAIGEEYQTLELLNYGYTVLEPKLSALPGISHEWCEQEWYDRMNGARGNALNPGTAFLDRSGDQADLINWTDMLEIEGKPQSFGVNAVKEAELKKDLALFSYTYPERLAIQQQVYRVIRELKRNPLSRQLYISVWDPNQDADRIGRRRVPCTLGYHIMERKGRVDITYLMRSCEFGTHFQNDVWLALRLMHFICEQTQKVPGRFSHFINSFHIYKKNVEGVF